MISSKENPVVELDIKKKFKKHRYNNSATTQRTIILFWFQEACPRLSTLEAREILGIMSPASRILELKQVGHRIVLGWGKQRDSSGQLHDVGVYIYMGLAKGGVVNG
jgi:hypothetical protein